MNGVTITGRLTRDIELRYGTAKGTAIAPFSLAVNEKWNGQETTTFVDCTAFGRTAEAMKFLPKGTALCVCGRLRQEEWTDKASGQQRRKLGVVADGVYVENRETAPANGRQQEAPVTAQEPADPF